MEKLDSASTPAQKEKVEVELKKEIKKLQRLRDLIKGWQAMSELKDKQAINEARRSIELEMERFKVLEKEMKIKAYSKEGLSQAAKLDPKEMEKLKVAHWINAAVDRLGTQTDAFEAELEGLQIQARKSKRLDMDKQERLEALPGIVERHKLHIRRLEQLLRFMENDKYEPDEVNSIKDDVEYYIEANQDPDFVPDETLYDQFEDLTNESEEEGDMSDYECSEDEDQRSPPSKSKSATLSSTEPIQPTLHKRKSSGSLTESKPASLSASSTSVIPGGKSKPATATVVATAPKPLSGVVQMPSGQMPSVQMPVVQVPVVQVPVVLPLASAAVASTPIVVPKVTGPSFASAIAAGATPLSQPSSAASPTTTARPVSFVSAAKLPSPPSSPKNDTLFPAIHMPGPYEELYAMIQKKRETQGKKHNTPAELLAILERTYLHCPDGAEMERSRTFTPKQPFTVPSYYPTHPPSILENPAIFERFELDTLFFIFYYQQKTYAQYLAARELKRQSWRFHKKYLTWFQRHEEPKTITDEFEQGTYIYFDYEGNWCQRKKSEFTFEYRYLEDEETV